MECPNCHKEIKPEWVYCHYCGSRLRETNIDESYRGIVFVYEYEQARRQNLDSKSATYIGFTSVVVAVLLAVGNLLFSPMKYTDHSIMFNALFALYICAIIGFTLSAVFAFRAYHTGSVFTSRTVVTRLLSYVSRWLVGTDVYKIVGPGKLRQFTDMTPQEAKRELIKTYIDVWNINHNLNNLKSDRILICYSLASISLVTIVAAAILLISRI